MKLKIFFAFSILSVSLFAQYKTAVIKLENNDYSLRSIDFAKNGFVICTGKFVIEDTPKTNYNLYYFKNNLENNDLTTVVHGLSSENQYKGSVMSLDGNYLYHIAQDMDGTKSFFGQDITQINLKTETQKKYRIKQSKIKGNVEFEFCDNNYFYALGIGYEKDQNGKIIEGLPFYAITKFKHESFEKSVIILQLPNTGYNNKTKCFWKYLGHDDNFIYMYRKKLHFKSGRHVYYFIALDKKDGSLSKQWDIPFSIRPNYIQPSSNISLDYRLGTLFYTGFEFLNNFYSKKGKNGYIKFPRPGAFGSAKVDFESNTIYIYGVYGNKKYSREDACHQGIYIYGYNFEGEKKFETTQDFSDSLIKEFSSVKEDIHSMNLISLDVYDNHLALGITLGHNKRITQRKKIILSRTGKFIKIATTDFSHKSETKESYAIVKDLIDNEKVLDFIKEKEMSNNVDEGNLTILKTSKYWDILKEVKQDSIVLYSFEK